MNFFWIFNQELLYWKINNLYKQNIISKKLYNKYITNYNKLDNEAKQIMDKFDNLEKEIENIINLDLKI